MRDQSSSRLEQVIALYLQEIEAGLEPDRDSLLSEHADLADELRSFFQNHDVIRRMDSTSGIQSDSTSPREKQQAAITTRQDQGTPDVEAADHQSLAEARDAPILPELGGYSMIRELGAGGMGQVFLALHRRMDRQVAIKFLPSELAKDDALVKRFHREAQVAARLTHTNIVTAHDAGEENGIHYLVMEYVDGADLGAIVSQAGPLNIDDSVRCIVQAGKGIAHAHQSGVIHRDIKPGNLLLSHDGVVKVLDMGLAQWSITAPDKTASDLSSSGMIMGTIDYLAPEQAVDSKAADQRSDLYSLGCSLYFLHRGEAIHPRDSVVEKLLAHREADPPSLVEEDDVKSQELNEIFHKMIARKSADRYDSVDEACAALQQWRGFSDDELKLTISIPKPQIASPFASTIEKARAQNVDTTRMGNSPQPASRSRGRWLVAASILSVVVIGLLSFPFLIKLRTPDGTLIVKCYIEGALVEIDEQRRLTVTDPSVKSEYSFELPPGEHRVRVLMPDGTEIRSGSVTITTGEGKLFEVGLETKKGQISKKESQKNENLDLEPNVHTVAQDGTAEYKTIQAALTQCQAKDTIRVIDDENYKEFLSLTGPSHQGITIEFTGKAQWKPDKSFPGAPLTCLQVSQSDITIRGARFLLEPQGFGIVIGQSVSNIRVEECAFDGVKFGSIGVSIQAVAVLSEQPPVVIRDSHFVNIQNGIRISGSSDDNVTATPTSEIAICDNRFLGCSLGCFVVGELRNILFSGNVVSGSTRVGIQCQHLLPNTENVLFVNNSFVRCDYSILAWENGEPDAGPTFINTITLQPSRVDWMCFESGGNPMAPRGPGDGRNLAEKWTLNHNYREGTKQGIGWIPPGESDLTLNKIELLSRDPEDPDYLRPRSGSPLATGGAGGELPSYVGAVPPSNVPAFDWEKYFTTVFRSKSKATE